ncbi:hypothetical protein [Bdellovibrio sp. HCB209]|uniref:hypothetical protein n=1 Tax=Bdellovibrio sp. HCB209 TaxID=3394354 RepID=UPI0039B692FE
MKKMIFALAFLMAGTASAAISNAKLCNPDNQSQFIEFEFIGPVIRQTSHNAGLSSTNDIPLKEAYSADQATLNKAAQQYGTPALVYGELWFVGPGAILVAQDANDIQYIFTTAKGEIVYMGSSATCK